MVGNGIYGVSELRGFDGNSLLLNTFADGSGLIIEEGGEIQAEKPLNLLSNAVSGVSSITIDGNAKNSIIDNDFNTLDAGSANLFNVNTGGTHDFTINNAQKFTIDTLATYRLPVKLLNNALQFQTTANIETIGTSNINMDLDGEFLDIASDPITDNALEFTTSLSNFSFNKDTKFLSTNNITFPLLPTPNGSVQILGGLYVVQDLQCNGQIYCDTINNIRPSGGVYSESAGTSLAGDGGTIERPILDQGTSYGSLSVPANGWTPGDTFAFKCGGQITCNNNATFTLRICSNFTAGGGGLNESDFASINVEVDGAQSADFWELELEFICRAVGGTGVAAISTNGHYSYFNNTDFSKGYGVNTTNTTTFNTTVDNTLQIGFFSNESAATLSAYQIDQVSLTKLY
jgi:hypothetical protein